MNIRTLVYCFDQDKVLLGRKKRGFALGKLNGYGGGKEDYDLSIEDTAKRELLEESSIECDKNNLEKVAEIEFFYIDVPKEKNWDQIVHIYFLKKWSGIAKETEEMSPEWHETNNLPYEKMWVDDSVWLPLILQGHKIKASFTLINKGEAIGRYTLNYVNEF